MVAVLVPGPAAVAASAVLREILIGWLLHVVVRAPGGRPTHDAGAPRRHRQVVARHVR
ncbi:hypothetical protein [Saccharothrix longispora]|uniref:hypothetical protein n=1 Tax=Saccharothrix longispora TaxID=33920 RepID=UPI0028FD62BE|nr:hypothetical protein [Saccharothrix longispora]MDU0292724.1 hypothetical protein [Saccharothrix longispora]